MFAFYFRGHNKMALNKVPGRSRDVVFYDVGKVWHIFRSIMTETGSRFTLPEVARNWDLFSFSMQPRVVQRRICFQ